MGKLTKPGPLRRGFDYQDAQAVSLFVEWLAHPNRYNWAKLEADEYGYLDDMAVLNQNGVLLLYQIKHSVHPDVPDDAWSWDDLLKETKGKQKSSLLKKWFLSWHDLIKIATFPEIIPSLHTNRKAAGDILASISFSPQGGIVVDIEKFKSIHKRHFEEFLRQIAPAVEDELNDFLKAFQFYFDQPSLDVVWEGTKRNFKRLGGDDKGWQSLRDATRKWATERDLPNVGGKITLDDIRKAAKWFKPKALNQEFVIPDDFVLFDRRIHDQLLSDLKKPSGGVRLLFGSPGIGKSTYLNKLYKELREQDWPVLRHNYFLSIQDPDFSIRLDDARAIEGLIHDIFYNYSKSLGGEAAKNPIQVHSMLRNYLTTSAEFYSQNNKSLVLIVDGLDHVIRYADIQELKYFLNLIFPPPEGLWIVFGSQHNQIIEDKCFPPSLFAIAPKDKWMEVHSLSEEGVSNIVNANSDKLQLPDNKLLINEICSAFFNVTNGHPLHLRYSIEYLSNNLKGRTLNKSDVDNLPPYGGNIEQYYQELWRRLPEEGKELAILLAVADFPLQEEQLVQCLYKQNGTIAHFIEGLNQIRHLTKDTTNGLAPFHPSFVPFVRNTNEYNTFNHQIKERLRDWITHSAPEDIKWAHLARVEYELGNPNLLLNSLNRDWITEALINIRPLYQITDQLRLGVDAAMKNDKLSKALELGLFLFYTERIPDEMPNASNKLWSLCFEDRFNQNKELVNKDGLKFLSTPRLSTVSRLADQIGRKEIIKESIDILNKRQGETNPSKEYGLGDPWWLEASALSRVAAYTRMSPKRFIDYAVQFRDVDRTAELLSEYSKTLRETGQPTSLQELLLEKLEPNEKLEILEVYAKWALKNKEDIAEIILSQPEQAWGPASWTYLSINGELPEGEMPELLNYDEFPPEVKEYLTAERAINARKFIKCYLYSLSLAAIGKEDIVNSWIAHCPDSRWSLQVASLLCELGKDAGKLLQVGKVPEYIELIQKSGRIREPKWPKDRDILELLHAFKLAIKEIHHITKLLRYCNSEETRLGFETVQEYCESPFCGSEGLLESLIGLNEPSLHPEAYVRYVKQEEEKLGSEVTYFASRAERYIDFARLADIHDDKEGYKGLLSKAASNMIAYGYHKDLYLFLALESIEACHDAGSRKANNWIDRVAPLVAEVCNYTDGDETNYLPRDIARVLAKINPDKLRSYYLHTAEQEGLSLAEDIFQYVVLSMRLDNPVEIAVAKTALDRNSIEALKKIAKEGNQGAKQVLDENEDYFGCLDISDPDSRRYEDKYSVNKSNNQFTEKDLLEVSPDSLKEYLSNAKTLFDREGFLLSWATKYVSQPEHRKEAYMAIIDYVEEAGIYETRENVLDFLYPLAIEFEGKKKGFKLLCRANAQGYGWDRFFVDKNKALKRWKLLKEDFPSRAKEFMKESLEKTGPYFRKRYSNFVPIPRGVEFLIYFDHLKDAEELTETSVGFAESLMVDLTLPCPKWLTTKTPDHSEILLSRLVWPSPFVREVAAREISELLLNSQLGKTASEKLINWLSSQKLESLVVVGLLPIVRAARKNPLEFPLEYATVEKAVSRPSVLSEILLKELREALAKPT
ncbi:MAG: hypothetical protein GY800_13180 [Planctomycetes bacterium]|nr:hypothetical protein [Planctomycetota bacterium]